MSFNTALSAGNLTSLRGDGTTPPRYHAAQYLSLCPNTTVFAARVNQASFTASFAQITFDTVTTGAFTDLLAGMTVYLSASNDIRAAYFVGRVRADSSGVVATSTVLNINETSADVSDNDFVFVINDFRVWDKLAREAAGVQLKDYALTFRQIPPVIYGLKSAYVGIVSGSPSGFTVSFAAQAFTGTSGATISSYAYTITSGMTVTAGSAATANVTIRFDAGFYWLKLVVTDSGSRTATRYIPVWSVPVDLSAQVALGFTGSQISGDLSTGFNATIEAFDGISSVYDNTLAVIWDVETYNGTAESIVGNVRFVGRLRNETDSGQSDETYSYLTSTAFEIEGAGSQLSRITAPLLALRYDGSPTLWDEITNLTLWRAMVHLLHEHSTFLTLHSLQFDSTANTFLAKILNTQGGNLLAAVQDLAQSTNAQLQLAYDGRCEVVRDLRYESTANRSAAVTVANWTTEDVQDLRLAIDHMETVGKSEAAGGTFNATSGGVTPLLAIAPGVAQGMGEGRNPLQRQILTASVTKATAQSELNMRVGHHFALSNPSDQLTITHPDGYHWLIPAVNQWYTWTLATSTNLRGRAYTTSQRWLCTQVSISHDNETGTKTVEATYSLETEGVAGQTVTYPPPATIPTPISTIPPFDAYLNFPELPDLYIADPTYPPVFQGNPTQPPTVAPDNGNTVMIWTAEQLWITTNFISTASPTWNEITPNEDYTIAAAQFEFGGRGAYVLVIIPGEWSHTFDFADSDGGFTVLAGSTGTHVPGSWWSTDLLVTGATRRQTFNIKVDFSSTPISNITLHYDALLGTSDAGPEQPYIGAGLGTITDATPYFGNLITGNNQSKSFTLSSSGTRLSVIALASVQNGSDGGGYVRLKTLDVNGTGSNPFGSGASYAVYYTEDVFESEPVWTLGNIVSGSNMVMRQTSTAGELYLYDAGNAVVRFSDDYGATWSAAITVGTPTGSFGGFDAIRLGVPTLAATDEQVEVATAAGGAYSVYGSAMPTDAQPSCIHIPRYDFGSSSSSNSNTNTPEYLVGSEVPSSGGETLWKVTASGATFTAITPTITGDDGLVQSPNALAMPFKSGNRIAAILLFDTARRLVVSTNAGGAWSDRGAVEDEADFITYRKGDGLFTQLFFADGADGPAYSGNHGAVIAHKSYPSEDALVGLAVYG